jgi:2-keto-3-deoxy-L-rhamnonate aldolase RhmA
MSFLSCKPGSIPAIGCTLGFGTLFSAQIIARIGYDYVLIDMEHNPLSAREAGLMAHVVISASAGQCKTIIRVPSHGVEWIKWALDSGAHGILVPMVKSRSEMEAIVQCAMYPPVGQRSFGPTMAAFADLDVAATSAKYFKETSKDVAIIPMIESVEGLKNAEEICSVEGVTAVFIGPVDLRLSMGLPGGDGDEDVFLQALQNVLGVCRRLGKPVGTFASNGDECEKRSADGFDFIMVRFFHRLTDG